MEKARHDDGVPPKAEGNVLFWNESSQSISLHSRLPLRNKHGIEPIMPRELIQQTSYRFNVAFPISSDHLIVLLQYNVLRACITNRELISCILPSEPDQDCSSAALHVLPMQPLPTNFPESLKPTQLQLTIPHEDWVDITPDPKWRDNMMLAAGTFDEDDLWADTIGGLFEGFPHSECEKRGLIVWGPAWEARGWEMSEGFYKKWGWLMEGCDSALEATNSWRAKRGEPPLLPWRRSHEELEDADS